ncbi:hypothetical protein CEXT_71351 [Caerostris extrusa]|uniref:Uncharacterized protein n=1 Tax=Caerostris extrusa TaxID=172846 RepID=A0AAV4U560_CAEEX|nr:hypothetical protein CEXT_71351 [Caerostris extrusa]
MFQKNTHRKNPDYFSLSLFLFAQNHVHPKAKKKKNNRKKSSPKVFYAKQKTTESFASIILFVIFYNNLPTLCSIPKDFMNKASVLDRTVSLAEVVEKFLCL